MANTASKENADTNVRFNEIYLAFRVEVDENAEKHGVTKASDFARVYEGVLEREEIRSSRVSVYDEGDISDLKFEKKEWKGKTKA
jgi:hypothetical protein